MGRHSLSFAAMVCLLLLRCCSTGAVFLFSGAELRAGFLGGNGYIQLRCVCYGFGELIGQVGGFYAHIEFKRRLVGLVEQNAGTEICPACKYHVLCAADPNIFMIYKHNKRGMHRLMQVAPAEAQAFIDAVIRYKNADLSYDRETEAQGKKALYDSKGKRLSVDKAMEEVTADEVFRLYNKDVNTFRDALLRVMNGEDAKAKEGVKQYKGVLDWLIQKLKALWNKLRGKGEEQVRAEIKEAIDELTELRKLFEEALAVAAERVKAEQENPTKKTVHEAGRADDDSGTMLSAKDYARKFQIKFTGAVSSVAEIDLSRNEAAAIRHALKTGYGKFDAGGRRGGVTTFERYYMFDVTDNYGVLITAAINNVDYNIHNERIGGVYDEAGRYDHSPSEGVEGGGRGSRYSTEHFSASSTAGEGRADARVAGSKQDRDTGGDQRQIREDGGGLIDPENGAQYSLKDGDEGASYEKNGTQYSIKRLHHDIAEGKMFADLVTAGVFTERQAEQLKENLTKLINAGRLPFPAPYV